MPSSHATPTGDDLDDFEAAFAQSAADRSSAAKSASDTSTNSDADNKAGAAATDEQALDAAQTSSQAQAADRQADADAKGAGDAGKDQAKRIAELEAELAQALHRERSNASRISATDRRSNDLTKQNQALQQQVADLTAKLAAKGSAAAGANPDDVLAKSPELQAAVQRRIDEATAELRAKLDAAKPAPKDDQDSDPAPAQGADGDAESCRTFLDQRFTQQWRKDVRSLAFARWLQAQPAAVQSRYETSVSPTETADLLERFYAHAGKRPQPTQDTQHDGQAHQRQQANPNPAPANAGQRQQERLKAAAGIAPKTAAKPTSGVEDDFDAAFAQASAARRQAQGQNHGKHLR